MTSGWSGFKRRFSRNFAGMSGLVTIALIAAVSILADVIFPGDPLSIAGTPFVWPGAESGFPLGTDMLGRDILTGIVHGSRVSLIVGLTATIFAVLLGMTLGALSGYFGGWVDAIIMRLVELFQTMPSLIFTIVVMVSLTPSLATVVLAIGLTSWPQVARLVRVEVLKLRESEFVLAAKVIGGSDARIILTHLFPNVAPIVVVTSSIIAAHAILLEAAISFLGLGDPNMISWGSMIGSGKEALRSAWYMAALPGVAIFVTVLSLSALGNGLNDALHPHGAHK